MNARDIMNANNSNNKNNNFFQKIWSIKLNTNIKKRKISVRESRKKETSKIFMIIKSLLISYIVSGILLIILAALLYKYNLKESPIAIAIIFVYILSACSGGYYIGKMSECKKYIWGFLIGSLYGAILLIITFVLYHGFNDQNLISTIILCIGGGLLGGMLS